MDTTLDPITAAAVRGTRRAIARLDEVSPRRMRKGGPSRWGITESDRRALTLEARRATVAMDAVVRRDGRLTADEVAEVVETLTANPWDTGALRSDVVSWLDFRIGYLDAPSYAEALRNVLARLGDAWGAGDVSRAARWIALENDREALLAAIA